MCFQFLLRKKVLKSFAVLGVLEASSISIFDYSILSKVLFTYVCSISGNVNQRPRDDKL